MDERSSEDVMGSCRFSAEDFCVDYLEGSSSLLNDGCEDDGGTWRSFACSTSGALGRCTGVFDDSGNEVEVVYDASACNGRSTPQADCLEFRGGSYSGSDCEEQANPDGFGSTSEVVGSCTTAAVCAEFYSGSSFSLEDDCQGDNGEWSSSQCGTSGYAATCTGATRYGEEAVLYYSQDLCDVDPTQIESACDANGGSYEQSEECF